MRAPYGTALAYIEMAVAYKGDDCLVWPFCTVKNGYGRVNIGGGVIRYAHRVVLERSVGPAPAGTEACHAPVICHNRGCVNPRHLRWATRVENRADCHLDGTHPAGERHGNAKLSDAQVEQILVDDRPSKIIAAELGVSPTTVRRWRSSHRRAA